MSPLITAAHYIVWTTLQLYSFYISSIFFLIVDSLYRVGQQILDQLSEIVLKFGQGEIENVMTNEKKGNDSKSIKIVAMTIPVIVKSRNLLRRYLTDFNVLNILLLV